MSKNDRSWIPDAVDLDWIESLAPPSAAGAGRDRGGRRAARDPDRRSRRRARPVGPGRRPAADRRGRHGLWLLDAVDGARPAGRRHDRHHRSRPRADRPRARLVARGGHRRRADHGRQRARRSTRSGRDPALEGPFDMVFIDALKPEYERVSRGARRPARAGRAHRRRQRPVERPGLGRAPRRGGRREHRTRSARSMRRSWPIHGSAPRSCRSATACSSPRGAADRAGDVDHGPGPPLRHPARAGRHARGPAGARRRGRCRGGLGGAGRASPGPGARSRVAPIRPERRLRRPDDGAGRRRRGRDDPAGLRGERRRAPGARPRPRPASSSCARRRSRPPSSASSPTRWPSPRTARSSASSAGRDRRPGRPRPGQETEAARHAGRSVDSLEYEALDTLALRTLAAIADEIAARFGVERLAIVHRIGEVPLGEPSIAVVAVAPHREAAFEAARYAIDETKARAPIWKAERFADGHVWIGHQARTGPEEGVMRVYLSVDMEGIAGVNHPDRPVRATLAIRPPWT